MARVPSVMIPLGTKAPAFNLPDVQDGKYHTLNELRGTRATLIAFVCNHCPFVKHINPQLVQLAGDYANKGVRIIAISSNDIIQYPEDGPEQMKKVAATLGYSFPYLFDETQEVAKSYQAVCTPDFFLYDAALKLVYRGQLDESRPGNDIPVTGRDIRSALDEMLLGKAVSEFQKPGIGCNIKWKE